MKILLEAKNISKSFPEPRRQDVLTNVSLQVFEGESIAICGRSGEGKTTLLHILGTLESHDSGEISYLNSSRKKSYKLRQSSIGFIFQSFNLLEDFTVLENVLMPASIARKPNDRTSPLYQRALELLSEVGLLEKADTRARLLSGGERQRVAIARALCNDPPLILADEPTGNLDRLNAERIGELLIRCTRSKKKSLLLVTHDIKLASMCNRIMTLEDGQLQQQNIK